MPPSHLRTHPVHLVTLFGALRRIPASMSSPRRRLLRLFLTGLVVVLLAGYGAFSTFFFNPMEGSYEFDIATLVPRDVDFFVSKADLRDDFDPFPTLACADEFESSRLARLLERQPAYQELLERLDVDAAVESLSQALDQSPIELEPLELFGGKDLALAGYFEGSALADSRWALLGRTNWMGKFGVELLDRPGWIGLDQQGISAEPCLATIQTKEQEVGVTLSGGSLTQPLSIGRVNDVVVICSDPKLLGEVARLGSVRGEDSFGLSAKFTDRIDSGRAQVGGAEGDEIELFVDAVKLSRAMGWSGAWPDRGADTFLPAFLGRLFQVAYVNELAGRLAFQGGLTVNLEGQLSSELMGNVQKRLYRQRQFDKLAARTVARLVPGDAGLFVYLRADLSDLLSQALDSLDQDTVLLFEDLVREVWGYDSAQPLIEDLDAALSGKVAFFLRPGDYAPSEQDPPNDGATVLVWALALVPQDMDKLTEILDQIRVHWQAFGLVGLKEGQNGIYKFRSKNGSFLTEYMNPLVPGTGQIATMNIDVTSGDDYFLVSNSRHFLVQIDSTFWNVSGAASTGLNARPDFEAFVNTGLPSASVLAWLNPRAIGESLRKIADENLRVQARSVIDWNAIRPGVEAKVLRENFGGVSANNLTQKDRESFEAQVEIRLEEIEKKEIAENYPRLRREAHDQIALWESIRSGLVELALDPKRLAFHARLAIPFESSDTEL